MFDRPMRRLAPAGYRESEVVQPHGLQARKIARKAAQSGGAHGENRPSAGADA